VALHGVLSVVFFAHQQGLLALPSVLIVAAHAVTDYLVTHCHQSSFPITKDWASHEYFDTCSAQWKQPLALLPLAVLAARPPLLLPVC